MSEPGLTGGDGFTDAMTFAFGDREAGFFGLARAGVSGGQGSALGVLNDMRLGNAGRAKMCVSAYYEVEYITHPLVDKTLVSGPDAKANQRTVMAAVAMRSSWGVHRERARHRLLLDLVARRDSRNEVLILDHPVAAVYFLPGRPGCVVVSSGAWDHN